MKKILSAVLAVLMMFSVVVMSVGAVYDENGVWKPENSTWAAISKGSDVVARFAIGADIHFTYYNATEKLSAVYNALKQIGGVDAFMIAGDLTHYGTDILYAELMEVVNKYTTNNPLNPNATGDSVPMTILSMGNHEYWEYESDPNFNELSYLSEVHFTERTGQQPDDLHIVSGVPVISLSPDPYTTTNKTPGSSYDGSYENLKSFYAQIDADSRFGNGSAYQGPVVIIAHHRLANDAWSSQNKALIKAHGGTVVYTGHSHTWFYNNNYFIEQDDGTTDVRVGALGNDYGGLGSRYINPTTGKASEITKDQGNTNCSIVLVDVMSDGTSKIRRLDIAKGIEIFPNEDIIVTPGKFDDYVYKNTEKYVNTSGYAAGSQAPSFAANAAVTFEDHGNHSSVIVKFPEATAASEHSRDYIAEYRIQLYNTETDSYVMNGKFNHFRVVNYRASALDGKQWEVLVHGLAWDTDYQIIVTAYNSYGVASEPITSATRVNVGHAEAVYPAKTVVDFDYTYGQLFDKTGKEMVERAATFKSKTDKTTGKQYIEVYPSSSVFVYDFTEDDMRTISNGFTMEAYFKPDNVTNDQMVAGSVSIANMALKISGGKVGLWAKFGTTPSNKEFDHVSTSITAKEWVHIVVTYDGKKVCLYKNGVLVDSTTENVTGGLSYGGGNIPEGLTPEEAAKYVDGFFVGAGGIMDNTSTIHEHTYGAGSAINKATLYQGTMTADDVKVAHKITTGAKIPFTDVIEKYTVATFGEWIVDSVEYAYSTGLVNGMTDTTFGPDSVMTRAQFVQMLYNFEKKPAVTVTNQFSDVTDGKWFADAVSWAYANGLVNGRTPTTFAPDDPINRQEAATLIYRYYKNFKNGTELEVSDEAKANYNAKYVDAASVGDFAVEAMQWANAYGIVNGTSETTLSPQNVATRAQVTKLFVGFVKKFAPPTIG